MGGEDYISIYCKPCGRWSSGGGGGDDGDCTYIKVHKDSDHEDFPWWVGGWLENEFFKKTPSPKFRLKSLLGTFDLGVCQFSTLNFKN